jgi:hypothetical protein
MTPSDAHILYQNCQIKSIHQSINNDIDNQVNFIAVLLFNCLYNDAGMFGNN